MSFKSLGNIFKAVGKEATEFGGKQLKNADRIINATTDMAHKGLNVADSINKKFFTEISSKELSETFSPAKHLLKTKAKKSTNWVTFGALAGVGFASGVYAESRKLGEISSSNGYDMVNESVNPVLRRELEEQQKNEGALSDAIQKESKTYGSSGAEIVFALHDLRNR